MKYYQQGFTLLEVFIALVIGLILFSGVLTLFVGMKITSKQTTSLGELQESGRVAISLFTNELLHQNFWGDFTGVFDSASILHKLSSPKNECHGGGVNNGSFPKNVTPTAANHFRTLWGQTVRNKKQLGCITNAKTGSSATNDNSDIIQLKRVIGEDVEHIYPEYYYLTANQYTGKILKGGQATLDNSRSWKYQHHIYYVKNEKSGGAVIPVLMEGKLTRGAIRFAPIIDGIEIIRFMYGVDTDNNGVANVYLSADNMPSTYWDQTRYSRIVAIQFFVLVRNIREDMKYTNSNVYQIGDVTVTFNDHYRRLLFSSTVNLLNVISVVSS